jgi:AmmeMemoRadiSam system protein A
MESDKIHSTNIPICLFQSLDSAEWELYDEGMDELLTSVEKQTLLQIAREALETGVRGEPLLPLDEAALTSVLLAVGASFVTLTIRANLRGCIGALEPYQPLAEDVREHAVAAALNDYRFPPVHASELTAIKIEISRLTMPVPVIYSDAEDLLAKLQPGLEGVILRDGTHRATFLPQVWKKLPSPEEFLENLCHKMGAAPDTWRHKHLEVLVYQVEEFHEY